MTPPFQRHEGDAMNACRPLALLGVWVIAGFVFAFVGCAEDDGGSGDDDGGGVDCDAFCAMVAECDLGDVLAIDSMASCRAYCEGGPRQIVDCVAAAADCAAAAVCLQPPDTFDCGDAGYTVRPFEDAEDSGALYATAADFTVQTTAGPWTLSEQWTGCETYLFIQDEPYQARNWPFALWERDVDTLLENLPDNAQVFFLSSSWEQNVIDEALADLKEQVDEILDDLSQDEQYRWFHRIHYVTEPGRGIDGWIGDLMKLPGWGIGVDRFQRLRYIGSYADPARYDAGRGWFAPNLSMAANEAVYYNFEAERDARLEAQDATVVPVFTGQEISDPGWAGVRGTADVEFPDAETMQEFDSMEFDLYLACVGDGEYGNCPAWDYDVWLYLCDEGNPDACDTTVGHWITTYHREGRWVSDVSGLLPLLDSGGTRRLAFYTTQPYEVTLSIRLYDAGKEVRPFALVPLFAGGDFDADYNDAYDPIVVPVPADAQKAELATVITGHGGVGSANCAEFCNVAHHFVVGGDEYVRDFPMAGNRDGCMTQVAQGTVPNQYGTWWYGRNGWCPGKEVPMVMTDVTGSVTPGQDAEFDYYAFYNGEPFDESGAVIRLLSWVVFSK
jgi:hypothetical protein